MARSRTPPAGRVEIVKDPWQIRFYDADGKLLTQTQTLSDPATFSAPTPFSFVRRARDLGHSMAASFRLAPDEKIFGCGESFTRLDKRGQKVVLYVRDAMGVQNQRMYKPIPFFLSSRGYGMFVHTSAPITCDFGQDFDQIERDLHRRRGARPVRVPRHAQGDSRRVHRRHRPQPRAAALVVRPVDEPHHLQQRGAGPRRRREAPRAQAFPADVIHLDTGWFETDWQCDYQVLHVAVSTIRQR